MKGMLGDGQRAIFGKKRRVELLKGLTCTTKSDLLDMRGKLVQGLRVADERAGGVAEHRAVPDAQEAQQHGKVLARRGREQEVLPVEIKKKGNRKHIFATMIIMTQNMN